MVESSNCPVPSGSSSKSGLVQTSLNLSCSSSFLRSQPKFSASIDLVWQLLERQVYSWFSELSDTVNQVLEGKCGFTGSRTPSYHDSVSLKKSPTKHRVEFDNSGFLSGHSDLLCASSEILQIIHDSFLGGLVARTV